MARPERVGRGPERLRLRGGWVAAEDKVAGALDVGPVALGERGPVEGVGDGKRLAQAGTQVVTRRTWTSPVVWNAKRPVDSSRVHGTRIDSPERGLSMP